MFLVSWKSKIFHHPGSEIKRLGNYIGQGSKAIGSILDVIWTFLMEHSAVQTDKCIWFFPTPDQSDTYAIP